MRKSESRLSSCGSGQFFDLPKSKKTLCPGVSLTQKPGWPLNQKPANCLLPIFFTWFYIKWPDLDILCWKVDFREKLGTVLMYLIFLPVLKWNTWFWNSAVAWGGAGGAWVPPIVWQARLIWSAAMLLMLLYGSLGLFRFAKACFLFFFMASTKKLQLKITGN